MMAVRYVGPVAIHIQYQDDDSYVGRISAPGVRPWKFTHLYPPRIGFRFAYDGPEAYDEMAQSALVFCTNEQTNPETAQEFDGLTQGWLLDNGGYLMRRKAK